MGRITTIQTKLDKLRELDKGFSIFGSGRHQYRMNPPISLEKLAEIERKNNIVLAEQYKLIMSTLGNGGAGCGYGLERLNLDRVSPPYPGTDYLLRNWDDPKKIDYDMVETEEISGYIRLFNYGCGMEYGMIVTGEESSSMIFFDVDDRFQKLNGFPLLAMYEAWLDESLTVLERVWDKLHSMSFQEVVDSEWEAKNFSIRDMILSLIGAPMLTGSYSGNDLKNHLNREYRRWKS